MQPGDFPHRADLVGPDQADAGDADRMQRAVERLLPEVEELLQGGKFRGEVIVLPDVGLQQGVAIGQPVNDFRGVRWKPCNWRTKSFDTTHDGMERPSWLRSRASTFARRAQPTIRKANAQKHVRFLRGKHQSKFRAALRSSGVSMSRVTESSANGSSTIPRDPRRRGSGARPRRLLGSHAAEKSSAEERRIATLAGVDRRTAAPPGSFRRRRSGHRSCRNGFLACRRAGQQRQRRPAPPPAPSSARTPGRWRNPD